MNCECYATITEDNERTEILKKVIPDLRIPLKHPLREGSYYMGDPKRINDNQKKILVQLISEKFGVSEATIYSDLNSGKWPILAENVIISICRMHVLCMM